MAHTPGPWSRDGFRVVAGRQGICTVGFTGGMSTIWPSRAEAGDNARLIAAAPSMAEEVRKAAAGEPVHISTWQALAATLPE